MNGIEVDEYMNFILDLKVVNQDITIRDYLKKQLYTLWIEQEQFSGKRPFGDSDWEYDVYSALVIAGIVRGKYDDEMGLEDVDEDSSHKIILSCIDYIWDKHYHESR